MQTPAKKMLHPPVPAFQALDVGFDLGIVRFNVMMAHGDSSLVVLKYILQEKERKRKSLPGVARNFVHLPIFFVSKS
jgi:hypothetical protein